MTKKSPFLESIRQTMRLRGYALKTEKSYLHWIRSYIRFHHKRHPKEMGQDEVVAFLNHLANQRMVSAGTQSIALNALAFLYNKILEQPIQGLNFQRANKPRRLPTVLSVQEVGIIINELKGIHQVPVGHYMGFCS